MMRNAIIALLSCYCIFFYGQTELHFTKAFDAGKKNVAIGIINNHPNYFHVLRYNKAAHDITIERRDKPNGHILAFTPLKLDSVNSPLFNYENLDYLWYEVDSRLYFVFEKVLNTKRTIYLKIIDTLGKSSGFIELSSLQAEGGMSINFSFSRGGNENTILIVGSINGTNGVTKKSAMLFDTKSLKPVWIKKLPHENGVTEITDQFTTNSANDLFYLHYTVKSLTELSSDNRFGRNWSYTRVSKVVIDGFSEIDIVKSFSNSKDIISSRLDIKNIDAINSATILPYQNDVLVAAHAVENDFGPKPIFFLQKMNATLDSVIYRAKHEVPPHILEQLTFFDGTDYKEPAYKQYSLRKTFIAENQLIYISERKDGSYYKELLAWRLDAATGHLVKTEIIPRKFFYFEGRTRYKKIGECMFSFKNDTTNFYLLEDPDNANKNAADFKYHKLDQQENLWGANVIRYSSGPSGSVTKKVLYTNKNFDLIPMFYESSYKKDELFYFNEGSYEKFAIIPLAPK